MIFLYCQVLEMIANCIFRRFPVNLDSLKTFLLLYTIKLK